jgi:predicted patatin/cPLA2 family phospholipase
MQPIQWFKRIKIMKVLPECDALILEGGSLRCAFTAGVLDAFAAVNYRPFNHYIAVSAGSMALTSFLSGQRKHFIDLAMEMAEDSRFISFRSAFSEEGLMNLSFLAKTVMESAPIDWDALDHEMEGKKALIVTTDAETGLPIYLTPNRDNWMRCALASSTLPLVTRGRIKVNGQWMFDGGYSDGIPFMKAVELGCKNILVVRTRPSGEKIVQGTLDYLASWVYSGNAPVTKLFESGFEGYNAQVTALLTGGNGSATWEELAPKTPLRSDGYYVTRVDLLADYHQGLEVGLDWLCDSHHVKS